MATSEKREGGEEQWRGKGLRGTNYHIENKLQGYIIQHWEYNQYFIITIN